MPIFRLKKRKDHLKPKREFLLQNNRKLTKTFLLTASSHFKRGSMIVTCIHVVCLPTRSLFIKGQVVVGKFISKRSDKQFCLKFEHLLSSTQLTQLGSVPLLDLYPTLMTQEKILIRFDFFNQLRLFYKFERSFRVRFFYVSVPLSYVRRSTGSADNHSNAKVGLEAQKEPLKSFR